MDKNYLYMEQTFERQPYPKPNNFDSEHKNKTKNTLQNLTPSLVYLLYQHYLDKWTPYTISRWVACVCLILVFVLRVLLLQGWYIICYALGIYHLNLFLAFLTPKIDPAYLNDEDDGTSLPTKANEEFRPFMRRLPEFKFWYSMTKSTLIATFMTFFQVFNIPVFWPILVMYFITLFCITMKRQIKHMIKYKYLPFSFGKPRYNGSEASNGAVPRTSPQ